MAFEIKQGDTRPVWEVPLEDNYGTPEATPITGLATATSITFKMKKTTAADSAAPKISRAATLVDAPTALVRHVWIGGDTDEQGDFHAEIEVVWADGGKETFPNKGFWDIKVNPDLDET